MFLWKYLLKLKDVPAYKLGGSLDCAEHLIFFPLALKCWDCRHVLLYCSWSSAVLGWNPEVCVCQASFLLSKLYPQHSDPIFRRKIPCGYKALLLRIE